jgi:hypothetical protein
MRYRPDLERRIDQWAANQADKPGRPEAIRRLIEIALTVWARRFLLLFWTGGKVQI